MQASRPLQCQAITAWVLEEFPYFGKTECKSGESIFAICGEWVSGLYHCDQSPLGTQLGVKTQPLEVTFGPKIDSLDAMINIK